MRGLLIAASLFLAGSALTLVPPRARAEEPDKKAEQGGSMPVMNVEDNKPLDLANPEDIKTIFERISSGEEVHLSQAKARTVFEQMADLGIWTIVIFVILAIVLWKLAWGPIVRGLHKREDTIRSALDEAEKAKAETARLRDQLQQEMAQSQDKVRQVLDEGRRAAQRQHEEMMAQARADIQGERDRLHREIGMARDQALQQLWARTADLATLVSSKAIRRQLTPDDHRRLVDEALAELRQTKTNGAGPRAGV
jgi:F-type H+-transporting ATPase subunit b